MQHRRLSTSSFFFFFSLVLAVCLPPVLSQEHHCRRVTPDLHFNSGAQYQVMEPTSLGNGNIAIAHFCGSGCPSRVRVFDELTLEPVTSESRVPTLAGSLVAGYDGSFAVVFSNSTMNQTTNTPISETVHLQVYTADNEPVGQPKAVTTPQQHGKYPTAVTLINNEHLAIIWLESTNNTLHGRIFDSKNWKPVSPSFAVSPKIQRENDYSSSFFSVVPLAAGGFVVAWKDTGSNTSRLYQRTFDNSGIPKDTVLLTESAAITAWELKPLISGKFVIAWSKRREDNNHYILGRTFTATGFSEQEDPFSIRTRPSTNVSIARITLIPLSTGGFMALYVEAEVLFARGYSLNASPLTPAEHPIFLETRPNVLGIGLRDGSWMVAIQYARGDYPQEIGIVVRAFSSPLDLIGTESYPINTIGHDSYKTATGVSVTNLVLSQTGNHVVVFWYSGRTFYPINTEPKAFVLECSRGNSTQLPSTSASASTPASASASLVSKASSSSSRSVSRKVLPSTTLLSTSVSRLPSPSSSSSSSSPSHQFSTLLTIFGGEGFIPGHQIFRWGQGTCVQQRKRGVPSALPLPFREGGEEEEEEKIVLIVKTNTAGGCGAFYYHENNNRFLNFTATASQVRFWLRSNTRTKVEVETSSSSSSGDKKLGVKLESTNNHWVQKSISLEGWTKRQREEVYGGLLVTVIGKGKAMLTDVLVLSR